MGVHGAGFQDAEAVRAWPHQCSARKGTGTSSSPRGSESQERERTRGCRMPEEDKERNTNGETGPEKSLGRTTSEFCPGSAPEGANWDSIDWEVGNKTEAPVKKN